MFILSNVKYNIKKLLAWIKFIYDFIRKSNKFENGRFSCKWKDRYPCLFDRTSTTGFDPHYLYHTAWASRILVKNKVKCHVDISSSLYFVTQLSAFMDVKFYDYRPANINLSGLLCGSADVTKLNFDSESIYSISCMHVIEHIGLERYGDMFDPEGDLKAINEIQRVVCGGG